MSVARKMMDALEHDGRGPVTSWLMFRATYAYTRSYHGTEGPSGPLDFGRWCSFRCALRVAWKYIRNSHTTKQEER